MLLGRLIKEALAGRVRFIEALPQADPALAARLDAAAARQAITADAYVAQAVRDLVAADDDASWTTITSALQGPGDPWVRFLGVVVGRRLRLDEAMEPGPQDPLANAPTQA